MRLILQLQQVALNVLNTECIISLMIPLKGNTSYQEIRKSSSTPFLESAKMSPSFTETEVYTVQNYMPPVLPGGHLQICLRNQLLPEVE